MRDGCSVLWVTKSSCVVDSVFEWVSAGVNMRRNVYAFMTVLQVAGMCGPFSCHFDNDISFSFLHE